MSEILVLLPFSVAVFLLVLELFRHEPGWRAYLIIAMTGLCIAGQVLIVFSTERHYPDPNVLQNAHTAIIGKLRAELDECREEK